MEKIYDIPHKRKKLRCEKRICINIKTKMYKYYTQKQINAPRH
jgi:hypothetical protein